MSPKILLADEPTGSLDSTSTRRFLDLLDRLGSARHDHRDGDALTRMLPLMPTESSKIRDGTIIDRSHGADDEHSDLSRSTPR